MVVPPSEDMRFRNVAFYGLLIAAACAWAAG